MQRKGGCRGGRDACYDGLVVHCPEPRAMMCDACKSMIGQPPFLQPHGALSRVVWIATQAGDFERYRCVVCATSLQRIVPKGDTHVTELHHWMVV